MIGLDRDRPEEAIGGFLGARDWSTSSLPRSLRASAESGRMARAWRYQYFGLREPLLHA